MSNDACGFHLNSMLQLAFIHKINECDDDVCTHYTSTPFHSDPFSMCNRLNITFTFKVKVDPLSLISFTQ